MRKMWWDSVEDDMKSFRLTSEKAQARNDGEGVSRVKQSPNPRLPRKGPSIWCVYGVKYKHSFD